MDGVRFSRPGVLQSTGTVVSSVRGSVPRAPPDLRRLPLPPPLRLARGQGLLPGSPVKFLFSTCPPRSSMHDSRHDWHSMVQRISSSALQYSTNGGDYCTHAARL